MVKENRVSWFVKLFVAFHVIGITIWSLPNPRRPVMLGSVEPRGVDLLLYYNTKYLKDSPLRYYLLTTGVWQSWDMFAPNPSNTDIWGDAEVVYQDGSVERYAYPRMYEMPILEKYLKERFRKFYERANDDGYRYMWPVFAQRIAYEMNRHPGNPPARVKLYRYKMVLDGPGKPMPEDYSRTLYYEHLVDQDALIRMKELW